MGPHINQGPKLKNQENNPQQCVSSGGGDPLEGVLKGWGIHEHPSHTFPNNSITYI